MNLEDGDISDSFDVMQKNLSFSTSDNDYIYTEGDSDTNQSDDIIVVQNDGGDSINI